MRESLGSGHHVQNRELDDLRVMNIDNKSKG